MNRFVALVVAVGLFVVAGSVFIDEFSATDRVLLLTAADRTDPKLRDTIAEFSAWGYYVTDRPEAALRASRNDNLTMFMVTRRAFDAVSDATFGDMYGRGVVIGGLNVSRSDSGGSPRLAASNTRQSAQSLASRTGREIVVAGRHRTG